MTEHQQALAADTTEGPAQEPPAQEPPAQEPAQEPPAPKDRRVLRAALRWTAAVAVFAVAGAGTAYGITRMERTDVPGLATQSDGRWDYPPLAKPPLPSGSPGPAAESNPAGTHHADLRALLLPLPKGAKENKALRGTDGWLPTGEFLKEYAEKEDREDFGQHLTDSGLRHIAARGWTTGDGTRTRIYLLHFDTAAVVETRLFLPYFSYKDPARPLRGAEQVEDDASFPEEKAAVPGVQRSVYDETAPRGAEHDRQAYLAAGDVLAVVLQSRKGTAHAVPFQQTVVLQSQLLG
ncbi:hypothetical protein ABZX82_10425 [Streptomyces griseoflavus]|uniref:hypothetical protein n=1 Tax=Streptomyces griseoflavus TaxID=35619 RepID=UPI0033BF87D8